MKKRTWNFSLLVLFLVAAGGFGAQAPGQDRAAKGWWGDVVTWPVEARNMVVLKNGKVLAFGGAGEPTNCLLFDPPRCNGGANDTLPCNIDADCSGGVCTYNVTSFPGPDSPRHILKCSGHTALADGKILFAGSLPISAMTTLYDPDVAPPGPESWIPQDFGSGGLLQTKRFYPTCTLQGDGTVLVTAGRHFGPPPINDEADTPAIFVPQRPAGLQWRSLNNATYADRTPGPCTPTGDFHQGQRA